MNEQAIKNVLAEVLTCVLNEVAAQTAPHADARESDPIPVELSARHVHLSEQDAIALFGAPLTHARDLSQPGQFLCKERVRLIGPKGVIAKSFARIFFRNSINNGLLLIEQPDLHDDIKEGDTVTVVMNEHVDYDGKQYPIASLPENLMSIIQAGGLVKAMRKLNGLD